ncbi:hypothetical protein FQR65_LT07325 [Abscondita terminalis]|nr:hypothetical protein FQR65_LT07325 [Abscondita terminalis]
MKYLVVIVLIYLCCLFEYSMQTGDEGQNCAQLSVPIPATVCSKWCVIPSPLGYCSSGLRCCLIVK